jgi:diguanylate cyclase (GGDEF)-like protein/PAS domain S-box-containing protein
MWMGTVLQAMRLALKRRRATPAPGRYGRLGWLLSLALLPGLATGCIFIATLYLGGRAQAEQEALRSARAMSQLFDGEIATRLARLEALATSPSLAAGDLDAFQRQAVAVAPDGAPIILADAGGQQLMNTLRPPGSVLPRSGAAQALEQALATGKPVVSGLFVGAVSGKAQVAVLLPLIRPGRAPRVLVQGIPATAFDDEFARLPPGAGRVAGLLDRGGLLIARSASADVYRGKPAVAEVRAALARAPEGTLATATLEGVPVFAAYSRSATTGWTVVVGVHERAMLAEVFGDLGWALALVAGALLAGALLAWRLQHDALRALRTLIKAAAQAERGVPGVRAEVGGPREFAQLAMQFNRMQVAQERARRDRQLAASVFSATSEGILIVGADRRIIEANRAFLAMSGYRRDELLGRGPRILQSGRQDAAFYARMWEALDTRGNWEGQIWDRRRDGSLFAAYLSISRVNGPDGRLSHYVSLFTDVTEQRVRQDEIEALAFRDPLTHLPNRRLLHDRLQHAIAGSARNGALLAVCSLDLDGFKAVNDSLGHEAGDEVLVAVAARLQQVVRAQDTVARLGGDEFVLLLEDLPDRDEAQDIAGRALSAIAAPIALACGASASVSASIGIAYSPLDARDGETLLRLSDSAMYCAKRRGRNRYVLHGGDTA